MKSSKKST